MKGRGAWGHGTARNRTAKAAVCIYRAPDVWQGIQSRALPILKKHSRPKIWKRKSSPLLHFIKCIFSIHITKQKQNWKRRQLLSQESLGFHMQHTRSCANCELLCLGRGAAEAEDFPCVCTALCSPSHCNWLQNICSYGCVKTLSLYTLQKVLVTLKNSCLGSSRTASASKFNTTEWAGLTPVGKTTRVFPWTCEYLT